MQKLRDATRWELIAGGYAALSIQRILNHAKVSKGALYHHYPSKDHLIAEAFADVLTEMLIHIQQTGALLQAGSLTKRQFLEQMSKLFKADFYIGATEISVGIRTNPVLGDLLKNAIANWRAALLQFWLDTFNLPGRSDKDARAHWTVASNALGGHAFSVSFGGVKEGYERHLDGFLTAFLDPAEIRQSDHTITQKIDT